MWRWLETLTDSKEDVLFCIVSGIEQSGTTMLSNLLRQHPDIDGRFEIGFYINRHLSDFRKEHNGLLLDHLVRNWNLSDKDVSYILDSESHTQAYSRLKQRSGIKSKFIYDKFPGYARVLSSVLDEARKPCLANVRDPRAIYASRKRRSNPTIESACHQIINGFKGIKDAQKTHDLHLVVHEKLCLDPISEGKKIYDYLGLDFSDAYVKLKDSAPNINQGGVSSSSLFDYREELTQEEQDFILNATRDYSEFHWTS